jgi:hypothetical protein
MRSMVQDSLNPISTIFEGEDNRGGAQKPLRDPESNSCCPWTAEMQECAWANYNPASSIMQSQFISEVDTLSPLKLETMP